jgi:hypothetical protein
MIIAQPALRSSRCSIGLVLGLASATVARSVARTTARPASLIRAASLAGLPARRERERMPRCPAR